VDSRAWRHNLVHLPPKRSLAHAWRRGEKGIGQAGMGGRQADNDASGVAAENGKKILISQHETRRFHGISDCTGMRRYRELRCA